MNKQINSGQFSTPIKLVSMAGEWLKKNEIDCTMLDSSCGNGVFFLINWDYPLKRWIGTDIDSTLIERAKVMFPYAEYQCTNSLSNVCREKFGIGDDEKLCVIGNPPYNDSTSAVKRKEKEKPVDIDEDIKRRDLGLSFLNSYNKLKADYALIIHPLAYHIKRTNVKAIRPFLDNYKMVEDIVFSSHEFADTRKFNPFPLIMALYKRREEPVPFNFDRNFEEREYRTIEGEKFWFGAFSFLNVQKYPHKKRYNEEILFWSLRDINALKRNKTFIKERCSSAVDVDPEQLFWYFYIDCFKRYADVPYWMANCDIPIRQVAYYCESIEKVARWNNRDVFGECEEPTRADFNKVHFYVNCGIEDGENEIKRAAEDFEYYVDWGDDEEE